MRNREKIIAEVAASVGLPQTVVKEIITSQFDLLKQTIRNNITTKSLYLKHIGWFMSYEVRMENKRKHRERYKIKKVTTKDEDPINFE